MAACPICTENYTDKLRKVVTCAKCEAQACRKCVAQYLLRATQDPHCMACRVEWDGEFLASVMTTAFCNHALRAHRADVLIEREKGFLPETVPYVEEHRRHEKVRTDMAQNAKAVLALREQIRKLQRANLALHRSMAQSATPERQHFVRGCPVEGCRGFLSTAWKCGVCEAYVCSRCHAPKAQRDDPDHLCDADAVRTAELLMRETKPCPSCAVSISKIDGCDQMWCTNCHTPFSWRTGARERGVVHNPHFFEWHRRTHGQVPRHPQDRPCGDDHIALYELQRLCDRVMYARFANVLRTLYHIEDLHLRRVPNAQAENRTLRIRYLLQELDEAAWKATLKRLAKKREKEQALRQMWRMLVDTGKGMIRDMLQQHADRAQQQQVLVELDALRAYVGEELSKVTARFKNKVPYVYASKLTRHWVYRGVGQWVSTNLQR
jgi:hypothetical protein